MRAVFVAITILAAAVVACGGASSPARTAPEPPIARAWKNRCGACHTRVEPGTRSRAELEEALSRHRKRVKLHESEWRELVAFLARPEATLSLEAPLGAPSTPTVFAPAPMLAPAIDSGAPVEATALDAGRATPDAGTPIAP
ncbi:MAG: hypothetical protein U0235_04045 [Polyangiaceae bacterium]